MHRRSFEHIFSIIFHCCRSAKTTKHCNFYFWIISSQKNDKQFTVNECCRMNMNSFIIAPQYLHNNGARNKQTKNAKKTCETYSKKNQKQIQTEVLMFAWKNELDVLSCFHIFRLSYGFRKWAAFGSSKPCSCIMQWCSHQTKIDSRILCRFSRHNILSLFIYFQDRYYHSITILCVCFCVCICLYMSLGSRNNS